MANGAASVASIGLPAWAEASCTPTRKSRLGTACCLKPQPPPDRPDPATYSQDEQFSLGTAPTWDSPDILTNYWNPFTLMPEATVKVRNLSGLVSAVNVQVLVATSAFGIGLPRTPMSAQIISLAPGQQSQLLFPFPQSLLQAQDGNFYGTASGGRYGNGMVFRVTPTGQRTTLNDFSGSTHGSLPFRLIQGADGDFYGLAHLGGKPMVIVNQRNELDR